ncbi:MAG: hypothetical protein RJA98_1090 [Pseudomonadota bacterium]
MPTLPTHLLTPLFADTVALARLGLALTEPNPRVGCLLLAPDGRVVGRGHTQPVGGPHAEVMALRDAAAEGESTLGAIAIVSLEPCAHQGRTPPCCDALVAAGVAEVHVALQDPNPLVAGQGSARLRAAGVRVFDWPAGPARDEAEYLNIGFLSRMRRGRPWVRLKVAITLDGRTALPDGRSQWITGEAARTDGHAWRRRAGATLTGVGTVRDDNPRLDVRLVPTPRQPLRVIVDSRLETPPDARILQAPGGALIFAAQPHIERQAELMLRGAEVAYCANPQGKVDLAEMLNELGRRGINELHVEAGHQLNGSFVREGLVDEYLVYVAPKLLGLGLPLASLGPLAALSEAPALAFHSVTPIGDDLRLLLRPR